MKKNTVLISCCVLALSCVTTSGTQMAEREYPDLPEPQAAVSPPVLQAQSLSEVLDLELKVQQGLATTLPLSRAAAVGLVVEAPSAALIDDRMPIPDRTLATFLKRKIPVTDLNGMQAVQVEVLSNQKMGATREEQLRLSGPLSEMASVADVLRPDYLLVVRFDAIKQGTQEVALSYKLDQASLEAYTRAHQILVQNADLTRSELRRIKLEQDRAFDNELAAYRRTQQQASAWNEFAEKVLPALAVKPRDSSQAEQRHRDFKKEIGRRLDRIDSALAASPAPDVWSADVTSKPKRQSVEIGYTDAWVTLIDAKKGTMLWKARFYKQDFTAVDSYQAVVEGILDRLYESKKRGPKPAKTGGPVAKGGSK